MKKLTMLILGVLSMALAFAQTTTWEHLPNYNGNYFKKCSMFNSGSIKGFALISNNIGVNSIVKTNDGGLSWGSSLILPLNISDILDIAFYDDLIGYISVRINTSPALQSKIFKTIDGGTNWIDVTPIDLAVGSGIADFYMLPNNANQVFHIIGNKYHVSTNGGATWNSYTFGGDYFPTCISFSDSLHGIVGAWDGTFLYSGAIYTTINGGVSWDSILLPSAYSQITSVISQSATQYAAISAGQSAAFATPKLYYTSNAAVTWDTIPLTFLDTINASPLQIIDGEVGNEVFILAEAPGNIYYGTSANGNYSLNYTNDTTFTCMCKTGNQLFAFGNNGIAIHTTIVTSNKSMKLSALNLSVYPNPANSSAMVTLPNNNCEVQLFNSIGQQVYSQKVNGTLLNLELTFDKGVYLLSASDGKQVWQTKLVVK